MRTLIILLFFTSQLLGQNLVPNPSFEEIIDAPKTVTSSNYEFIKSLVSWTTPNTATPDIITPQFKSSRLKIPKPHTGTNMIGILAEVNWSEYAEIKLKEKLIPNNIYYVEFWIRRTTSKNLFYNFDQLLNKNFGILLLEKPVKYNNTRMIDAYPQVFATKEVWITDKKWTKISAYYTPATQVEFLYLGQFKNDLTMAMLGYFVIDDLKVEKINTLDEIDQPLSVGVKLPISNLKFKNGSDQFSSQVSENILLELSNYLKKFKQLKIKLKGHTDSKGNDKKNQILSEKRAKKVFSFLIQQGIKKERMTWEGFGETLPLNNNSNSVEKAINRRVEFEVVE